MYYETQNVEEEKNQPVYPFDGELTAALITFLGQSTGGCV